jgi:hypothetical protein
MAVFSPENHRLFKFYYIITIWYVAIFFVSGCHKDHGSGGNPQNPIGNISVSDSTGSISGSVVPANGAFVVRATSGTFTVSSGIDSLGNFNFRGLEYGSYLIQPYPTAGYLISGGILVLVLAPAPNITLSPINLQPNHSDGRMEYTLDSVVYRLANPYTYARSDSSGVLIGSNTELGQLDHWSVSVTLDGVNGPGSYPVGNTSNYNFSILRYVGATVYTWGTISGGSGLLNITTMDTASRRISGTFTVTAVPESTNTSGNVIISDGSFTSLYYAEH